MFMNLPRRKRRILYVTLLMILIGGLSVLYIGESGKKQKKYIPGEAVKGLTSELDRGLPGDVPKIKFTNVADSSGIHFHHFGGTRTSQIPEDMGSGAAWGDYDNDGWEDLFVVNMAGTVDMNQQELNKSHSYSRLYHNNGDGTFTETTAKSGINHHALGMAAAWADFNDDGWLDLVITSYKSISLYKNNGDGTFKNVTRQAGLSGYKGFWTDAAWGDYNRDGYPDLYITGYVHYVSLPGNKSDIQGEDPASINPSSFDPVPNLFFINKRDGTFAEMAKSTGISNPNGRSLSAAWCDFDDDGWVDLYVANDVSDNVFYRNRGDGTFEEMSHSARIADYRGAMGLATGDWNGDTSTDLFITHWIAEENGLYTNQSKRRNAHKSGGFSRLQFSDQSERAGLGQVSLDFVGWGTSFIDLDNDGRLDLFVDNGSTQQKEQAPRELKGMEDLVFWNGGKKRGFYNISKAAGPYFKKKLVGRGAAFADYDHDGDMDVFIVNYNGRGVLLRNDTKVENHWLELVLRENEKNKFALGAKVKIITGKKVQVRKVNAQGSYLSQNALAQHIGLGKFATVDSLEIFWPDGDRQVETNIKGDRRIIIRETNSPEYGITEVK